MRLINRVSESYKDITKVGGRFWYAGLQRVIGKGVKRVNLAQYGDIYIRCGDSDFATLRQVFRDREYHLANPSVRRRLQSRYDEILASGATPVIVDAGANIGAASIWLKHDFPRAHVVAIEPDPDNAAMLRRNLMGYSGATVMQAAIGGERGAVSLVQPGLSWAVQTARGTGETPIVTMADAVAAVPGGALFIAKIDIEGFESDLFSANTGWIDDAALISIEPHDWMMPGKGTSRNFQTELGKRPFELYLRGENIIYVRMDTAV